jgi:hypothetical protein
VEKGWNNYRTPLEEHEYYGKPLETLRKNYGKPWKNMNNMENLWKNMNNMENFWKNCGQTMENLWKNMNNM